ncbi:MAG: hypothetical protein FJ276_26625, partial [Planctomycetes bacterium]|nr:hypothetical protein [Planctomycetota bacterium]
MTTLHKAAEKNQAATARELIAAGADVDAYDGDRTPLHCAVIFGSVDVTMVLIDNGAKVEAGDLHRLQTPLHFCADRQGHPDIADVLLSHGANIDVLDGNGNTPLYMAAAKGNLPMTEFFLARGANVNSRNHRGETPLDGANSYGHRKVVSFLQSKGGKTRREIDDEERQRKREQEKSTPSATKNASEQPKQS